MRKLMLILLATVALVPWTALYGAGDSVQYPDNFRRWGLVETGVIVSDATPVLKNNQGIHHIFANQKAFDGYGSGEFPDGSVIVFELREAQKKAEGVLSEGERKRVDVMIKDSGLYKDTGGWRFERFWGTDQTQDAIHDGGASCFQCHSKAQPHGYVFGHLN